MPIRLRMAMHGQRHNRIFHLVAINQRARRDAKPMELLGIYDPALRLGETHKTVKWSVDRIKYWLGVGALPSKSAVKLLEWVSLSSCICIRFACSSKYLRAVYYHQTPSITRRLWVPELLQSHQKTIPLAQVALKQLQRRRDSIPGET
jgi:ribosomal protein S16